MRRMAHKSAGHPAHVAQIFNLLYRRFAIGGPSPCRTRLDSWSARRLKTCDTADCKSALLRWRSDPRLPPGIAPRCTGVWTFLRSLLGSQSNGFRSDLPKGDLRIATLSRVGLSNRDTESRRDC